MSRGPRSLRVDESARTLYEVAARLSGIPAEEVEVRGRSLLATSASSGRIPAFRSTLNNDGSPLQVCVTSDRLARAVRLLGEPGSDLPTAPERLRSGRGALARLILASRAEELALACEQILDGALPEHPGRTPGTGPGVLWLATGLDHPGIALYVKAGWGESAFDHARTLSLLRSILGPGDELEAAVDALTTRARFVSVGVEGAGARCARVKLYWRLTRPASLDSLGIPLLADPAIKEFLVACMGDRPAPLSGLVFSAGFLPATGGLHDVKVDVCAHCLPRPPAAWLELIDGLVRRNGLVPAGLDEVLSGRRAEIAFVGLGVDRAGGRRLNVYLKAISRHEPGP